MKNTHPGIQTYQKYINLMDDILFDDVFINIAYHLAPIDLYKLSRSCKIYDQFIPKYIKINTINEIKKRLHCTFNDDYDEFMELLKINDATVMGSFITQCMLDEIWTGGGVLICITKPISDFEDYMENSETCETDDEMNELDNQRDDSGFIKFMTDRKIKINKRTVARQGTNSVPIYVHSKTCKINGVKMVFFPLYHNQNPMSAEKFLHSCSEFTTNKNMYKFATNDLYVHTMKDIFNKHTNWIKRTESRKYIPRMCRRGFKFYNSDDKIMTPIDIIRSYFPNTITIRSIENTHQKMIGVNKEFIIDGNVIYLMMRTKKYVNNPIFEIIESPLSDEKSVEVYQHLCINKCKLADKCVAKIVDSGLRFDN